MDKALEQSPESDGLNDRVVDLKAAHGSGEMCQDMACACNYMQR